MAKITDFTQDIFTSRTNDDQFIALRATDSYRTPTAVGDWYDYNKQDACITGRFSWHGKCKLGAALIVWRHIELLDSEEVANAIKIAKTVFERYSTSRDSARSQDYAFWQMMNGKRIVHHGRKGAIEWVAA